MTQLTADSVDLAARCAAVLRAHPAVADAVVVRAADSAPMRGGMQAFVVPVRGRGRIPAQGTCTVVIEDGSATEGALVDVSFDGLRVRCADSAPEVGRQVLVVIESPVLGGIDGRLGVVRWRQGHDLGVAFAGNFDGGHDLLRFVQSFVDAAHGAVADELQVSPHALVGCELRCVVHLGHAGSCAAKTLDVSASGLLVELALAPSVDWRAERITLDIDLPGAPQLKGSVARQEGARLGILLDADPTAREFLIEVVRAAVRDTTISRMALIDWSIAHGIDPIASIEFVEGIPRLADGEVDEDSLRARLR